MEDVEANLDAVTLDFCQSNESQPALKHRLELYVRFGTFLRMQASRDDAKMTQSSGSAG
jgi:hypothetical protein